MICKLCDIIEPSIKKDKENRIYHLVYNDTAKGVQHMAKWKPSYETMWALTPKKLNTYLITNNMDESLAMAFIRGPTSNSDDWTKLKELFGITDNEQMGTITPSDYTKIPFLTNVFFL